LLAHAEDIKQPKRRENLIRFADQARISRELVKLRDDVPVEVGLDEMGVRDPDPEALLGFLSAMEFNTLTRRAAEAFGMDPPPPGSQRAGGPGKKDGGKAKAAEGASPFKTGEAGTPQQAAAIRARQISSLPVDRSAYVTVSDIETLQDWIAEAKEQGYLAVDTETDSLDAMRARLVGISLATQPGRACYVPLAHGAGEGLDLEGAGEQAQIAPEVALAALKPLLEDRCVLKIGQNFKYDLLVFLRHGIDAAPMDDTMLISYAEDSGRGRHGMDELALRHLGHVCIAFKDIAGSGKSALTFDQIPIDKASEYASEDADITLRLWLLLKPRLVAESVTTVYETLERPLAPVLARMERRGVRVERAVLSRLSGSFAQKMAALEHDIHEIAGESFNIASPRQLGEVLFDKMGLPGGKRTKSGQWETRAGLLDDLAAKEDLPEEARKFIQLMLEWRQLSKLKSTYTDALPEHINPQTGRIHTSYAMAATSTGRLASTDPNLQNIPVRTPEGRAIRSAFVAEKGNKLISADYSQIELRVLAHMADIEALQKAFEEGLDIHAMTASEIFGVPLKEMTPEVRRRAKAINFGIIYGISPFGLANQLGISRSEAADYI
ncbi:MAG: DNA polymerase I, partial [Alphaproteobacteria bacterium]